MSYLPRRANEPGLTLQTAAAMFAAGPSLEIVEWNDGAEALLGFTRGEALGRRCHDVLGCPEPMRRLCREGERREPGAGEAPVPLFENEISTRSGERIWVSVTTLLAASGVDLPLRVHVLRELRRQRQLEELLRQVLSTAAQLSAPLREEGEGAAPFLRGVTAREQEVVRLLARGSSTAEIAAQLGIAPRTARNHIQNILCKLRVHSRLEAVARASARRIV